MCEFIKSCNSDPASGLGHLRKCINFKVSIIVPTYNEKDNVRPLFESISSVLDDFELIYVDDNSPDGTAGEITKISDPRVRLIKRPGKLGLGSAILAGAEIATGDYIAMMDADFSHGINDLIRLIESAGGSDIVVGSRYIPGGKITGWPLKRHILSRGATLLARVLLCPKIHDPMSGFAIYKKEIFSRLSGKLNPRGFKLLLEILVKSPGAKVREVPIVFRERANGRSKLDSSEINAYLKLCGQLYKERQRV